MTAGEPQAGSAAKLATGAVIAIAVHTLTGIPTAYAALTDLAAISALQDGTTLYMQQIIDQEKLTGAFHTARLAAAIAAGATFLAWYWVIAGKNPDHYGNRPLAVASWMVPPFLAFAPLLKARALWKSEAEAPRKGRRKRRKQAAAKRGKGVPWWLYPWWISWLAALSCEQAAAGILTLGGNVEPTAQNIDSWLATLAMADVLRLIGYTAYIPAAAGAVAFIRRTSSTTQPMQEKRRQENVEHTGRIHEKKPSPSA